MHSVSGVNFLENDYQAKLVCGTTEGNQQTPQKLDTIFPFETILLNAPIEQQLKKTLIDTTLPQLFYL